MAESTKKHHAYVYAEQLHSWTDLTIHTKNLYISDYKSHALCSTKGRIMWRKKITGKCKPCNSQLGARLANFCLQFHLFFSQGKIVNKCKELGWRCWERIAFLVHSVLVHHHDVEIIMGDPQQQPELQCK